MTKYHKIFAVQKVNESYKWTAIEAAFVKESGNLSLVFNLPPPLNLQGTSIIIKMTEDANEKPEATQ